MPESLSALLESSTPAVLATGFVRTEGPLWHPDGHLYFSGGRPRQVWSITPGQEARLAFDVDASGATFDLEGRVVLTDGIRNRRVVRIGQDGELEVVADRFEGKRLNRPNDLVCHSDGSIYFTDPGLRMASPERELDCSGVYRVSHEGAISLVTDCEYPNGLAFSPDERILYVANSRWTQYIHAIEVNASGVMQRRWIFADMSPDRAEAPRIAAGTQAESAPDGIKVDVEGRVYCAGPGGVWVFAPSGEKLGVIELPEMCANLCFGGDDLRTLFCTARASVYTLRTKAPGVPHPWYKRR